MKKFDQDLKEFRQMNVQNNQVVINSVTNTLQKTRQEKCEAFDDQFSNMRVRMRNTVAEIEQKLKIYNEIAEVASDA